jgi:hypothetical protein
MRIAVYSAPSPGPETGIGMTLRAPGQAPFAFGLKVGDTFILEHATNSASYNFTVLVVQEGLRVVKKEKLL